AAILEALYARETSGKGSVLSVSLFDATAEWMAVPLIHHDYGGRAPPRVGPAHPPVAPYGAFSPAARQPIAIPIPNAREWARFCDAILGDPALASDPRFSDNNRRVANRVALDALVSAVFAREPRAVLGERLKAADIAFGNLNTVEDFSRHPHLRRLTTGVSGGDIAVPAPPSLASGHTERPPVPPPGDHG